MMKELVDKALHSQNMTKVDLCRHLGIGRMTLWRWRNGVSTPNQATINELRKLSGDR